MAMEEGGGDGLVQAVILRREVDTLLEGGDGRIVITCRSWIRPRYQRISAFSGSRRIARAHWRLASSHFSRPARLIPSTA